VQHPREGPAPGGRGRSRGTGGGATPASSTACTSPDRSGQPWPSPRHRSGPPKTMRPVPPSFPTDAGSTGTVRRQLGGRTSHRLPPYRCRRGAARPCRMGARERGPDGGRSPERPSPHASACSPGARPIGPARPDVRGRHRQTRDAAAERCRRRSDDVSGAAAGAGRGVRPVRRGPLQPGAWRAPRPRPDRSNKPPRPSPAASVTLIA
jgi:hypothetical protein